MRKVQYNTPACSQVVGSHGALWQVQSTPPNRLISPTITNPFGTAMSLNPSISHEDIARRAYQIWEETGRREGSETAHWLQAKRELHAQNGNTGEIDGARGDEQKQWSQRVTQNSNALDLESGVFTWDDPVAIARSLKASADASDRRKSTAFRSAMSMLTFYMNRAGRELPAEQRTHLEAAKDELRVLFDRPRRRSPFSTRRRG
jgi:hypothetical protein